MHPRNDVFKASIIPRKGTLGVVYPTPVEEWAGLDRNTLLADIKVCIASYVAEKMKFGVTTTGVSGDFRTAMRLAHSMVWHWGMGPSGLIGDYTIIPESQLADDTKNRLNQDVTKIITECQTEVENLLRKENVLFERFAHELLTKLELDYDEIEAIFAEYGKANPRHFGTAMSETGSESESSGRPDGQGKKTDSSNPS